MRKESMLPNTSRWTASLEAPHEWSGPYFSDQVGRFKNAELFVSDALLLGKGDV